MIFKPNFIKNADVPLMEYPRPQFQRDSYFTLNGVWQYAIRKSADKPIAFDGDILVPYSPETKLSMVEKQLKKDEYLIYKRYFTLPNDFNQGKILLNAGAIDQVCTIYINGKEVGSHEGGYTSFTLDVSCALLEGENEIMVVCRDDAESPIYGRGKQSYNPHGIWYTATSGIWQSIWLESVPNDYITKLELYPKYDDRELEIIVRTNTPKDVVIEILDDDNNLTTKSGKSDEVITFKLDNFKEWTPNNPELYPITIKCGKDVVNSYFGLRKFSKKLINGAWHFTLNDKPFFYNGLLDQGYFEGSYTPKSNKDFYDEILSVKTIGFNMLRKHIKIEPMLWYYYCDILGVTVWQDMVNGGDKYKPLRIALCPFINLKLDDGNYKSMGREIDKSREQYYKESEETISQLFNVVSLAVYTPFNECWGQFDAVKTTEYLKKLDPSRLYDHASGWQDMGGGDVRSRHIYFRRARPKNDKKRVLALTEFGGYSYPLNGHVFTDKKFGYKIFKDGNKLTKAYENLYLNEVIPLIKSQDLGATVYTQLTDVEEEINGLFTFDRVLKIDKETLINLNNEVYKAFDEKFKK